MHRGSDDVAGDHRPAHGPDAGTADPPPVPGYGRARLWLGISAVGTIVTASAAALALDAPGRIQAVVGPSAAGQAAGLLGLVLAHAVVQFPFDLLGGYVLPKRFARSHPSLASHLGGLARGAAAQAAALFVVAAALTAAGRYGVWYGGRDGGVAATAGVGLLACLALFRWRTALASVVAPLAFAPAGSVSSPAGGGGLPARLAHSVDEGFTGAIVGVLRPRGHVLPARWRDVLSPRQFELAVRRRAVAAESGSWRRGRLVALLFTGTGLAAAASLVGPGRLGTAGGTVALSLWFSLWSFLGLLVLPTLSRRGVVEVDDRVRGDDPSAGDLAETARRLDALQDGEQSRPRWVEAVFHPIPSVANRLDGRRPRGSAGCWDAARTSVYLSLAGVGLLGRAVHCNCGRPALWVFLPAD